MKTTLHHFLCALLMSAATAHAARGDEQPPSPAGYTAPVQSRDRPVSGASASFLLDPPRLAAHGHRMKVAGAVSIAMGSAAEAASVALGAEALLHLTLCGETPWGLFYDANCAAERATEAKWLAGALLTGMGGIAMIAVGIVTYVSGGRDMKRAAYLAQHMAIAPTLGPSGANGGVATLRFQF